jgi:hypothetical protein
MPIATRTISKMTVVFGLFNKLKKGPIIVKTNPRIEEKKNLGNLKIFSQKSGIVYIK